MSKLAEVEKAVKALSQQEKIALLEFLGSHIAPKSETKLPRSLAPQARAEEFKQWAASHKTGPGLPASAVGRDAIYD